MIIAVLCLSAIMMGGLLAVDKVFHNPEEMYLRGNRRNRYSPDGTYLGATADVYNGFGSWWGYICFDSKNRVTETVGKYEYLLRE